MAYDSPEVEEKWCSERRNEVADYLQAHQVEHGRIGEWPAWHLMPYVSIWAIESKSSSGWVGWWVICGDLPTDYVSSEKIKHPRDALKAIATRWLSAAVSMARGESSPEFSIGPSADWKALSPQLESRAQLLQDWADEDELWRDL
ncbi:DUF4826 family protein [Ectopseudomonas hydrolytica]|jgi:hypothetical protein|uniref:DUF4826 family protein n=1 Tax=Ectopseudomonas hydrolytica TaxID=2493633 RepID=UPI0018A73A5A|nr:DUF4826 family protein [Pseudomonas hydrolytica]MBF8161941.1 DUF4826 family protein [Pseudomonas mendocina]UTH31434.1 DUF4826 family protein [Pseudomonas hydrolytica]UZZ10627.1 DUF4826 family protein [Pseudomonas mendocina]